MTFTIAKTVFSAVLARIQGITSGRVTMPILSNVQLKTNALRPVLHVLATDLEVGFETVVDLDDQPETAQAITLPAKKLHEIVKACPAPDITVQVDFGHCRATIASGTYSATIGALPADDFPALPQVEGESFDLDAAALVQILGHVDYAESSDTTKYNLCGCFLKLESSVDDDLFLTAVATDGHRLALDSLPLPGEPRLVPKDLSKGIIIASKGIAELRQIRKSGIIVLNIAGNHLQVATETEKLFFRLVDGEYPDFDRVIPQNLPHKAETKREPLIEAIERIKILSEGKSRKICLNFAEGGIALRSEAPALQAESADHVAADVNAEPCEIFVNADYLLDALNIMDSSLVELRFSDGLSPLLVNPHGTDEPLAVIMPQRG